MLQTPMSKLLNFPLRKKISFYLFHSFLYIYIYICYCYFCPLELGIPLFYEKEPPLTIENIPLETTFLKRVPNHYLLKRISWSMSRLFWKEISINPIVKSFIWKLQVFWKIKPLLICRLNWHHTINMRGKIISTLNHSIIPI